MPFKRWMRNWNADAYNLAVCQCIGGIEFDRNSFNVFERFAWGNMPLDLSPAVDVAVLIQGADEASSDLDLYGLFFHID